MTASNTASPTWRATQEYVAKEHLIHYIPESSNTIPLYESEACPVYGVPRENIEMKKCPAYNVSVQRENQSS